MKPEHNAQLVRPMPRQLPFLGLIAPDFPGFLPQSPDLVFHVNCVTQLASRKKSVRKSAPQSSPSIRIPEQIIVLNVCGLGALRATDARPGNQ